MRTSVRVVDLTPSQKGAIAEAEVAAAAIRLGLVVSRPLCEGARYDLIIDNGHGVLRVQCKYAQHLGDVLSLRLRTNRHTPGRGYVSTSYRAEEVDAIAAYSPHTDRCYVIPIERVNGRKNLFLRLAPPKNNQALGIMWAADYELGAVAQLGERLTGSQEAEGSSPASSTTGECTETPA